MAQNSRHWSVLDLDHPRRISPTRFEDVATDEGAQSARMLGTVLVGSGAFWILTILIVLRALAG